MSDIHIGTSGWHYQHWRGNFYRQDLPSSAMLGEYTKHLRTVEINNSFYRLPTTAAVESWVAQTPKSFLFALKASRYITHMKKLLNPETTTAKFFVMADGFGKKLGPILFQLPPSWQLNADRLTSFLAELPSHHRYAFEFRHPSWQNAQTYRILERFNAALCIFDIGGFQSPIEVTADWVYVRLHGPGNAYQGKYTHASMQDWARRIQKWSSEACDAFIYFDNDQSGFAAQNAMELGRMLSTQDSSALSA